MDLQRSVIRYRSIKDPLEGLRMRLKELAMARVGYGYKRLHVLLLREGWRVNHKCIYRLYKEEEASQKEESMYEKGNSSIGF